MPEAAVIGAPSGTGVWGGDVMYTYVTFDTLPPPSVVGVDPGVMFCVRDPRPPDSCASASRISALAMPPATPAAGSQFGGAPEAAGGLGPVNSSGTTCGIASLCFTFASFASRRGGTGTSPAGRRYP